VAELASAKTFMIAVINCRESKLSDKPIYILDLRTVATVGIPRYLINPTYILELRTVATVAATKNISVSSRKLSGYRAF
jgi:hypothetical protein